jgi:hypothetical protein
VRDVYRDDDDLQETQLRIEWMEREERRIARREARAARRAERVEHRDERRQDRVLVVRYLAAFLPAYVLSLALLVMLLVAWAKTGDARFGVTFLVAGAGILVGVTLMHERGQR